MVELRGQRPHQVQVLPLHRFDLLDQTLKSPAEEALHLKFLVVANLRAHPRSVGHFVATWAEQANPRGRTKLIKHAS